MSRSADPREQKGCDDDLPVLASQCYVVAQRMSQRCTVEQYAVALAKHFVNTYPLVSGRQPSTRCRQRN